MNRSLVLHYVTKILASLLRSKIPASLLRSKIPASLLHDIFPASPLRDKIPGSPLRVPPSPSRFSTSHQLHRFGSINLNIGQIAKATHNFWATMQLGEGGFGTLYKAQLPDGHIVAIKRAKKNVEVVDVEEGEEHTFEDNHRIFSLRTSKFFRLDLRFFIELYCSCIFHPILKSGQTLVETSVNDPISLNSLMNNPSKVADLLGFDSEVLMFIDQAKFACNTTNFPEDLIFGHPMFYGIEQKMKYHETLCTEYLGHTMDKTIYNIDKVFYYWRNSFENKEVEQMVWYVLRERMERAGKTDFTKFEEDNKNKYLFRDFCMLYYNTKKHMERVVGEEGVGKTGKRLEDVEIYKLVDELLGGGTITEIHGRLMKVWFNDPVRLAQLLDMMSFY